MLRSAFQKFVGIFVGAAAFAVAGPAGAVTGNVTMMTNDVAQTGGFTLELTDEATGESIGTFTDADGDGTVAVAVDDQDTKKCVAATIKNSDGIVIRHLPCFIIPLWEGFSLNVDITPGRPTTVSGGPPSQPVRDSTPRFRPKLAENLSAMPADRVYFNYNFQRAPAQPGQFFGRAEAGGHSTDLPNYQYGIFADFAQQIIFKINVFDFDNDDVGAEVEGAAGYVFKRPLLGRKSWIEIWLNYAAVDGGDSVGRIASGGADMEFNGPVGGGSSGATILGGADLTDVEFDYDHDRLGFGVRLSSDIPRGDITWTPFIGVGYDRTSLDTDLRLSVGAVDITRRDDVDSDNLRVTAGLNASRLATWRMRSRTSRATLHPLTFYGGGHLGLVFSDADGDSTLTIGGTPESARDSDDAVTFMAGAAAGLRFDFDGGVSAGVEIKFDYRGNSPNLVYSAVPDVPVDIQFDGALSWSLGANITVPLPY